MSDIHPAWLFSVAALRVHDPFVIRNAPESLNSKTILAGSPNSGRWQGPALALCSAVSGVRDAARLPGDRQPDRRAASDIQILHGHWCQTPHLPSRRDRSCLAFFEAHFSSPGSSKAKVSKRLPPLLCHQLNRFNSSTLSLLLLKPFLLTEDIQIPFLHDCRHIRSLMGFHHHQQTCHKFGVVSIESPRSVQRYVKSKTAAISCIFFSTDSCALRPISPSVSPSRLFSFLMNCNYFSPYGRRRRNSEPAEPVRPIFAWRKRLRRSRSTDTFLLRLTCPHHVLALSLHLSAFW